MSAHAWLLLAVFLAVLLIAARPLGTYIARLVEGEYAWARRLETPLYRLCGVRAEEGMGWLKYAVAIVLFNVLGLVFTYAVQRLQGALPLNPQAFGAVAPDSAFNTAISFVANTNWQAYAGESTLSYLTQMLALAVQNFLSAATGIAVVVALIRGFARHSAQTIGNAWVDLTRITLYVLVPLSVAYALFLTSQGAIQNFDAYKTVTTLEVTAFDTPHLGADGQALKDENGQALTKPATTQEQTLPMGPLASQEAIKLIGTNGGGFFNANSAHPFENPTPLSNFTQVLAIFLIPCALCFTFGRLIGDTRQGWAVLAAMTAIFVLATVAVISFEQQGNPLLHALGVDPSGGNMEGKEIRFGIADSSLFAAVTTAASCGAVNSMHDSYTPLGGMVPLVLMQLGEVVFGGVGSGLYGMLVFAIIAVFVAGLMIGRTPEYLGKKIETFEMKMSAIIILVTPILVLVGTAVAVILDAGRAGIANPGAHGFSETLYAFTSAANNNGSAFAGLSANTPFYNVLLGLGMWFGRFAVIVPVLAMAGAFAAKKRIAATPGTLPTHGPLFVTLLIGIVLLVGLLNYVPALALGPIVEHLTLAATH